MLLIRNAAALHRGAVLVDHPEKTGTRVTLTFTSVPDDTAKLRTVLLGKGAMVGMMAVFGQSLLSSLRNPGYLVLAIAIWGGMYWVSKQFCKKHDIN